jgi:hypothetical protein
LTGARLVITEGATRREIALSTVQQYDDALGHYFGIRLDAAQTTAV